MKKQFNHIIRELEENNVDPDLLLKFIKESIEDCELVAKIKEQLDPVGSIKYNIMVTKAELFYYILERSLRLQNDN